MQTFAAYAPSNRPVKNSLIQVATGRRLLEDGSLPHCDSPCHDSNTCRHVSSHGGEASAVALAERVDLQSESERRVRVYEEARGFRLGPRAARVDLREVRGRRAAAGMAGPARSPP